MIIYFIIEEPCLGYFTEKVSQTPDGLARSWAAAPLRNCLTSSSTLFTQPKAAGASPRMEASGFHPDQRSD